jgi:hypothetical protein
MSNIQPGDGYSLKASSSGFNLDIDKPWTPPIGDGLYLGVNFPEFPPFPDINGPGFPDLPENLIQQFQVETLVVGPTQYVRIASGAVNFTVSNMPEIYKGAVNDTRQAWIYAAAVRPSITAVDGGDPDSPWMENGGYYSMPSSGTYYVTISKLDMAGSTSSSTLIQENAPFVSIFAETDPVAAKIFSQTGSSQYLNMTNVQKMQGYDAASTGLTGDFGNCHTTWFLPVHWGYSVKLIAVISAYTPPIVAPTIEVLHAATATSNEVHRITLPPAAKKSGSFQLQYAPGFTTDTTDPFDPFNPLNSGNLSGQFQWNLANALKAIQELKGSTSVTASGENKLDITYINGLANTSVTAPAIINNTVGIPTTTYEVSQQVIGSIDLSIPLHFIGTTLMNVPNWTEAADDPYNAYETNGWNDISNYLQKDALESIVPNNLAYYDLLIGPADWTAADYSWTAIGGCIEEPGSGHPFKVTVVSEAGGMFTYHIQSGTVNNVIPGNIATDITVSNLEYDVFLKVPYVANVFPDAGGFEWDIATTMPPDTDSEGYVKIATVDGATVTQFVTGSLWADRIKLGTATATYYYARI